MWDLNTHYQIFQEKTLVLKVILVNLTNIEYNELAKQSVYYSLIMGIGTILMLIIGYFIFKVKTKTN